MASFQHYLLNLENISQDIDNLLEAHILILPISFGGHAITLIKIGSTLIRCDRGAHGKNQGSVIYYDIGQEKKFTKSLCKTLLYKRQHARFINQELKEYLALQPKRVFSLPLQKTGNCSWANVEAVIPAIIFELLVIQDPEITAMAHEKTARRLYHEWRAWHIERSLDLNIQNLHAAERPRQAAKAALLAAVLFQSCDPKIPRERLRANKILAILTKSNYIQILKCYTRVFAQNRESKLWENFCIFLAEFGIEAKQLLSR